MIVNGLYNFTTLEKDGRKIVIIGEAHGDYPAPNALDIVKMYTKSTTKAFSIFAEVPDKDECVRRGDKDVIAQTHRYLKGRKTVQYHRCDIRDAYIDRKIYRPRQGPLINGLDEVPGLGIDTRLESNMLDIWNSDERLVNARSGIDPDLQHRIRNVLTWCMREHPDIVEIRGKIAEMSHQAMTLGQHADRNYYLIHVSAVIADWYLLSKLLHPASTNNAVVYVGGAHAVTYTEFLKREGFTVTYQRKCADDSRQVTINDLTH